MLNISSTTYRAARLLTESSAELILDGAVTVSGQKIVYAGPWGSADQEIPVRDLGDVTLMPGLFDCHVHLSADPLQKSTSAASLANPPNLNQLMQTNALRLLDAGVTTARDLAAPGTVSIVLRDAIARGDYPGPRLLCANPPITVKGGHCGALGGEAEGLEEVSAMARKRVAEGANVIKVMSSGGFMTAGSKPSQATYTVEELAAIADIAHAAGIPVTTHATAVPAIERACDAGFDTIEHCSWITEDNSTKFNERIALKMKARGMTVCPTMNSACRHEHYYCPWDGYDAVLKNLTLLREVGVKVIAGTDSGIGLCRFERYADGLVQMNRAGYTPREIIRCATDDAAEACRVSDVTGKLVAGLDADLLAVEGNPLESVEVYFKPTFVMARGRQHQLTPIGPFGDHAETIAEMMAVLKKGAGHK